MTDNMDGIHQEANLGPPEQKNRQKETRDGFFAVITKQWRLVFTLFLLFLVALMYLWKTISVDSVTEKMREERKLLSARVDQIVLNKNIDLVRLSALPLSWAVRNELLNKNYENIDRYFQRLIRESRFTSVALTNTDGTIIVATDKKLEGAIASRIYPTTVLGHYETTVKVLKNGDILAVAPVLDASGKLGDLIIVYSSKSINLGTAEQL